ncbi:MAG: DUF4197 family protein [Opitutaceae bacterium]|jgi:hypothetical protein
MKSLLRSALFGSAILIAPFALHAETAATPAVAPATFSTQQLTDGLKSGLGSIITQALGSGDLTVKAPSALAKIQAALSKTDNAATATGFSDAFSSAVAKVSPQAGGLIQGALKDLNIADAKALLAGGPNAATTYLQKTAGASLRAKLLPLVKQATASSGLATKGQEMLALAGPLAGFGGSKAVSDLDGYICDQVLAQSFALIGKGEAAARANPALLKDNQLAQKVFALFKK